MSTASTATSQMPAQFADLRHLGHQLFFKAGTPIFQAGDDAEHCFYLVRGVLRLSRLLLDGRRHIADFCDEGDLVGLDAELVYEVTAESITDCVVTRFRRRELETASRNSPSLQSELLELTRSDVARLQARVLQLGCQTARERVAAFLIAMAARRGESTKRACTIELPMTRQDIGDYLGLTTETVSRSLSEFKHAGTIRIIDRTKIVLNDPERLSHLAEGDEDDTRDLRAGRIVRD